MTRGADVSNESIDFEPELPTAAPVKTPIDADGEPLPRVVAHPDGYYWVALDGHQQFGPYATFEAAVAAMDGDADGGLEPGETLPEAESELGIADWVDPESGEPAEQTATHVNDEH
jgi:hypothetical protein